MSLIKSLTPKDTEEIKPGLFIQKKGDSYRHINPLAWNGKFRTKEQLRTVFNLRTLFFILIVCWLYFSFLYDYRNLQEFYEDTMSNPQEFCISVFEQEQQNSFGYEVENGKEYTNTLPSYP